MNSKKLTLLSLFLLLPTAIQCMKRERPDISESSNAQLNPAKPKTIQELQAKHELDYESFAKCQFYCDACTVKIIPFFQLCWPIILQNCKTRTILNVYKKTLINNYSFLGLVAIAHKEAFPLKNLRPQGKASYTDKKKFINQLLAFGFIPTQEDKEVAFLAKWKEYFPKIIKPIYSIRYINPMLEEMIPQELKDHIATLTFYAQFDEKESLL